MVRLHRVCLAAVSYAALTVGLAAQETPPPSGGSSTTTPPAATTPGATPARLPQIRISGRKLRQAQQQRARRAAATTPPPASTPLVPPTQSAFGPEGGGVGPVTGYTAKYSVTSTKTDTPVLTTPQSISIVPKDQIADQGVQTIGESLRYTPGVTLDAFSANTFFDSINVRGFEAQRYLDGLRLPLDPGTQFAYPRIEPYGLERIEVLKGPSSGLYGQTNPGGLVNMLSKRPTALPQMEFTGQIGSFQRYQGTFDISGPLDKTGQYLFRMVGLARDSNTQIDYVEDNKLFIAPSFTWRPTPDTNFTVLSHYQKIDNKGFQQYVPGTGSLLFNPNGIIPYNRYIGEPSVDGFKLEQGAIGYALEHRFDSMLQFRQNFRYLTVSNDLTGVRTEGLQPDLVTSNRSINYVLSDSRNIALDNQLQADFATGPLMHKVLLGLDYFNIKSHSDYRFSFINPINVYNPVYGAGFIPPASSLTPFILSDSSQRQTGVYAQDQIKVDRFTLTLTGRHDWATTQTDSNGLFPPPGSVTQDDTAFTYRAGLNYLFDFGLAPYLSYATSFVPITGVDASGAPFRPTTGEGKEIGLKYNPPGTNLFITTAAFDITQQNVLTADPNNVFFNVQTGEARVQGFEVEARGNLTRELEIVGGYSRLDPRVTKSNDGNVGKYLVNIALEQASLWAKYTWYSGPLAGFGIGGGVRYVGESYADGANTVRIPPYTLYDAALSYDFAYWRPDLRGWKAQLNATNLFDKYYVASCVVGITYCGLGASRTVLLTLKYAWQQEPQLPPLVTK